MQVLIIDNYDSFTYNLVHIVEQYVPSFDVFRNDKIDIDIIDKYDGLILSPGPGLPKDAGILIDIIKKYSSTKKILGVCLGCQAIAEAFGGKLENMETVRHGQSLITKITDNTDCIFAGLPPTFNCGRYHSWVIDKQTLPESLEITAVDDQGYIMAVKHKAFDVRGVQFHPESVMTEYGKQIIKNWLKGVSL